MTARVCSRALAAAISLTALVLSASVPPVQARPAAVSTPALPAPPVPVPACNRVCLEGFVDRYLDAMLAHDPSLELFARDTRFTENGIRLPFGHEGLWFDMSGKGTYKFYVPDVETQQVAFIGTVREGGKTTTDGTLVAFALRLKIADHHITEVEQLAIRPDNTQTVTGSGASATPPRFPPTGEAVEKMGTPNPIFAEVIPEAKRPSREELIRTANYYFAGLQRNDGKGYYPFTDDCDRFENGMQTTNIPRTDPKTGQTIKIGCKKQFEENLKGIVSRVRDRRFVAVDRERGIAFAFAFFDHERINWTWQLAELFKIENGQIRRIEAVFHRAPYGINSGWSTYEDGISEEPQIVR
jgi:hypothetical protein